MLLVHASCEHTRNVCTCCVDERRLPPPKVLTALRGHCALWRLGRQLPGQMTQAAQLGSFEFPSLVP
jgi:hypothetical protein